MWILISHCKVATSSRETGPCLISSTSLCDSPQVQQPKASPPRRHGGAKIIHPAAQSCSKSFTADAVSTFRAALLTRLPSLPSVIPRVSDSGCSQAPIRPRSHIERRGRVIPNSLPIQNLINGQLSEPRRIKPHPCILWLPGQAAASIEIPSQTPPDTTPTSALTPYSPRALTQQ